MGDPPSEWSHEDPAPDGSTRPQEFPPAPSPRAGKPWWRRRWRRVLLIAVLVLGGCVAYGAVAYVGLTHELIMVDFREGVEPFNIGESEGARYDHGAGTYRITVKNTLFEANTSLGEFTRTAYAVGIRAELVEVTRPGTSVGVMCVGPASEGADELVGYGFFVEAGGKYSLVRQDSGGSWETLEEGTDERIEAVRRVSIMCVPVGDDVALIGFANGLKVVVDEDRDGHDVYTYAGLSVQTEPGTEVRFTRVVARVPDEEWVA